ncbi:MAG: hypothetical protein EOO52_02690 [Gammaproteobacteria bacterium]|nr:MAG: hypothetical protein EOO52_02690 [Gammaproteobacteria bacterium]
MNTKDFLQQLQDSTLGVALSESIYMYPIVEGLHLISLIFSFGLILLTDLRLVGLFLPGVPVQDLLHKLRPWLISGFVVTFITGFLLVFVNGPSLMNTWVFPLKLLLIVFAGLNAVWFEYKFGRQVIQWGHQTSSPKGAKIAGWVSLTSWSLVIVCGRLIPYLNGH